MTIEIPWRSIVRVLTIVVLVPTIENHWLAGRLAPEVAADHRRIEHTKEH